MSVNADLLVVGAGAFGVCIAATCSQYGLDVCLLERDHQLLNGASGNNQNRLHHGLHYPRDFETAKQSIAGARVFADRFPSALRQDFPNYYLYARDHSRSTPDDLEQLARRLSIPIERVDLSICTKLGMDPTAFSEAWTTHEGVIDVATLRRLFSEWLTESGVWTQFGCEVLGLTLENGYWIAETTGGEMRARAVVLATYGLDRLEPRATWLSEFQSTVVPILRPEGPQFGMTILDGDFFTLLPHGFSDNVLAYSPGGSVTDRRVGAAVADAVRTQHKPGSRDQVMKALGQWLPDFAFIDTGDALEAQRCIPAHSTQSDARRSSVVEVGTGLYRVISGKVDHAIGIAERFARESQVGRNRY